MVVGFFREPSTISVKHKNSSRYAASSLPSTNLHSAGYHHVSFLLFSFSLSCDYSYKLIPALLASPGASLQWIVFLTSVRTRRLIPFLLAELPGSGLWFNHKTTTRNRCIGIRMQLKKTEPCVCSPKISHFFWVLLSINFSSIQVLMSYLSSQFWLMNFLPMLQQWFIAYTLQMPMCGSWSCAVHCAAIF